MARTYALDPPGSMSRDRAALVTTTRPLLLSAALFLLTTAIFWVSPVHEVSDSNYSMLLSYQLLTQRRFTLDEYFQQPLDRRYYPGLSQSGYPYQIDVARGHIYYVYPPGPSVLSVPFVALASALGVEPIGDNGRYDRTAERTIQVPLAAALMGALTVVFFLTGRAVLPDWWSAGLALAGALGSPVWSTASRVVWSQTWQILLLGIVALLLVRQERGLARGRPWLIGMALGTLLAWAYMTRPLSAIPLALIGVYLLLRNWRQVFVYGFSAAAWLALFVLYSYLHFERFLPKYFVHEGYRPSGIPVALAGLLVSPSRGLFVFMPVLLVVGYVLIRYRRWLPFPRLVLLSLAICVLHVAAVSPFPMWWGGFSYGPRLLTDIVPWLMLLTVAAASAWRQHSLASACVPRPASRLRWALPALALMLSLWGIALNGRGATSDDAVNWNSRPESIDSRQDRLWDWRQPQFLAGLVGPSRSKK